jgi:hypothetical protein
MPGNKVMAVVSATGARDTALTRRLRRRQNPEVGVA